MNVNPMQLIQLIRQGNNPQQRVMSILQQNTNNPILNNASNLAQMGNVPALETLARNLAKQRGLDFDTQFMRFKNSLR